MHFTTCLCLSKSENHLADAVFDFVFELIIFKIWILIYQINFLLEFCLNLWIFINSHCVFLFNHFEIQSCIFINAFVILPRWILSIVTKSFAVANIPDILNAIIVEFFDAADHLFVTNEFFFEVKCDAEVGVGLVVQIIVN